MSVYIGSNTGTDTISGGSGALNVTIDGNSHDVDTIIGGAGGGTIAGVSWDNSTLLLNDTGSNIQNISSIDMGYGGTIAGGDNNNHTWNFSGITLSARETVVAGQGNDTITGGAGTMSVYIGSNTGTDTISGGAGKLNVTIDGNSHDVDTIVGGAGGGTIAGVSWDNSTLLLNDTASNIQNIQSIDMGYGGTIAGGDNNNHSWNFSGITLSARETVVAGAGNDTITGGEGTMSVYVGSNTGTDTISGGHGSVNVTIDGNSHHVDTIVGGAGGHNTISGVSWDNSTLLLNDDGSNIQNIQSIDMGYGGTIAGGDNNAHHWDLSGVSLTSREVVQAGSGDNTITVSGGNLNLTAGNGNNTITDANDTAGDTITMGNGNNTIDLSSNSSGAADHLSLGSGSNNLLFGAAANATVNVTGSHASENVTVSGGTVNLNLTGTSGYNTVSLHSSDHAAWGTDTVHLDMTGHDVVTGNTSSNWMDVLDLSASHNSNAALYLHTDQGWTELTGHGTVSLDPNHHDGQVFNDHSGTQSHDIVDFTHIEKIIY